MNEYLVRLHSIELNNFKNVEHGIISLPKERSVKETLSKINLESLQSNVFGVYGQNGSGKTALIDALYFLHLLLLGKKLDNEVSNYIQEGKDFFACSFSFILLPLDKNDDKLFVTYSFSIKRENSLTRLKSEKLTFNILSNNNESSNGKIIEYDTEKEHYYEKFMTDENMTIIRGQSKSEFDRIKAFLLINKDVKSFIFEQDNFDFFVQKFKETIIEKTIRSLSVYAKTSMFIIRNNTSSDIMAGKSLRFINLYTDTETPYYGSYVIKSQGSLIKFLKKDYEKIKRIIDCQNVVLQKIIPGMILNLEDVDDDVTNSNEIEKIVILQSLRNGVSVPLKYESDGIKKIVYLLNVIIEMYNNSGVFLAVDEIDSGIFEYLLGEIIKTVEKTGKGQLLFTSHNLRPLELISSKSVYLTTINPKNRYRQISGVRETNNLRKLYYTNIQLGSDNESEDDLYDMVDTYLIADALREAGKVRE